MVPGSPARLADVTFITPEALKTRLDAGEYLCLIDARDLDAFGTAHIPGAQWCAQELLQSHIGREAPTPYVPLVLYCSHGDASARSVPLLHHLGYAHIFVVQGGFIAWCAAGFPVQAGMHQAP